MTATFCTKCGAIGSGREGRFHSGCRENVPGTWETAATLVKWLRTVRTHLNESEAQRHAQAVELRTMQKRIAELQAELDGATELAGKWQEAATGKAGALRSENARLWSGIQAAIETLHPGCIGLDGQPFGSEGINQCDGVTAVAKRLGMPRLEVVTALRLALLDPAPAGDGAAGTESAVRE